MRPNVFKQTVLKEVHWVVCEFVKVWTQDLSCAKFFGVRLVWFSIWVSEILLDFICTTHPYHWANWNKYR